MVVFPVPPFWLLTATIIGTTSVHIVPDQAPVLGGKILLAAGRFHLTGQRYYGNI